MKTVKRWSAIALAIVLACLLVAPGAAMAAGESGVLNVRYAPAGKPVNSTAEDPVLYKAYKLASVTLSGGVYTYTLTPAFAGSGIDVNGIMAGTAAPDTAVSGKLLVAFGTYINENGEAIEAAAGPGDIRSAPTAPYGGENGIARFTGLSDGLYLVTTSAAWKTGGKLYIPTPFVTCIPYVFGGGENRALTAAVKFTTSEDTPTPPSPSAPPTGSPPPSTPPTGSTPPSAPPAPSSDPSAPSASPAPGADVPGGVTPTPPASGGEESSEPVDPPDHVELLPEDVPLGELPEFNDPAPDPGEDLGESDVPLGELPQTGQLWWPVFVMAAAGAVLVVVGVCSRKKQKA